jgi:hypothetical protein
LVRPQNRRKLPRKMSTTQTRVKFAFKIEPKPEGGFVARSEEPPCTIEGATRDEIDAKIREKIGALLAPELAAKLDFSQPGVHIEKKFSFALKQKAEDAEAAPPKPDSLISTSLIVKLAIAAGILLLLWRLLPHA